MQAQASKARKTHSTVQRALSPGSGLRSMLGKALMDMLPGPAGALHSYTSNAFRNGAETNKGKKNDQQSTLFEFACLPDSSRPSVRNK